LDRLRFYDKDSNPIIENIVDSKKRRYLKDIKADYNYFRDSYNRADLRIDINNLSLVEIPYLIINELQKILKIPKTEASCSDGLPRSTKSKQNGKYLPVSIAPSVLIQRSE